MWEVDTAKFISATVPIYSLCFKRDNSQLIVACANELLFFEPRYGILLGKRLTHHAQIHCVRCSCDGTFFASASMDGLVVVWRSISNEGFVQFNASGPAKTLCWSPNKQILVACSTSEYQIWHPDDSRAVRTIVSHGIVACNFSPLGNLFLLVFDTGDVNIIDVETNQIVQTFSFSKLATAVSFAIVDEIECVVVADLEKKVSLFKVEDKSLIGRNSLSFECLAIGFLDKYFMFSGVSDRVCLMTGHLSYLGEFATNGDWVWDTAYDGEGKVAISRRDGVVEVRKVEFALAFACFGHLVSYRTSLNSLTVQSLVDPSIGHELSFPKIVFSIAMSSEFLLVHFTDVLIVYRHSDMRMMQEIPGSYENSLICLSDRQAFVTQAKNRELHFMNLAGHIESTMYFDSEITFLTLTDAFEDSLIVGCHNGDVLLVTMTSSVLLVEHRVAVVQAIKRNGIFVVVDEQANCTLYNAVSSEIIQTMSQVASYTTNETIDGLSATSDNSTVSIYYNNTLVKTLFLEGSLLLFYGRQIVVSNQDTIEVLPLELDFPEFCLQYPWPLVVSMIDVGVFQKQWRDVFDECLKRKEFGLVRAVVPESERDLRLMVYFCDDDELLSVFQTEPTATETPHALEAAGDGEKALDLYALDGDWPNVLRIVKEYHLERHLAELEVPPEYSEDVAKILLNAGFGDSAIRILTGCENYECLAKTHVCLGQWKEAISLCHIVPSVAPIIFPKLSQILLESDQFFEALVCLFVVTETEIRRKAIESMKECCAVTHNLHILAVLELMTGFNEPETYWQSLNMANAYVCADHLRRLGPTTAMSEDHAHLVFYMSYFVCACHHARCLVGVDISLIHLQLLFASSVLGQKRWVAYCLRELMAVNLPDQTKRFIQRCARSYKEASPSRSVTVKCGKCGSDLYAKSRVPLLVCGLCGSFIPFSATSGRPIELVHFKTATKNALALINTEPQADKVNISIPTSEFVSDDFLELTPPEHFVAQCIKKEAGVSNQYWFNPSLTPVRQCRVCGSLFHEDDYEKTTLSLEACAICSTYLYSDEIQIGEYSSDLLDTLHTFAESSPVLY